MEPDKRRNRGFGSKCRRCSNRSRTIRRALRRRGVPPLTTTAELIRFRQIKEADERAWHELAAYEMAEYVRLRCLEKEREKVAYAELRRWQTHLRQTSGYRRSVWREYDHRKRDQILPGRRRRYATDRDRVKMLQKEGQTSTAELSNTKETMEASAPRPKGLGLGRQDSNIFLAFRRCGLPRVLRLL